MVGSEARRIRNLFWVPPGEEVRFDEFKQITPEASVHHSGGPPIERYSSNDSGTLVLRQQSGSAGGLLDADPPRKLTMAPHLLTPPQNATGFALRMGGTPVKGVRDD
jgi:hypothetical protein